MTSNFLTERKKALDESQEDVEKLTKQLKSEQVLKMQAVNKLAEILQRKENLPTNRKGKPISSDLKKKEKECRKLQQELTMVSWSYLWSLTLKITVNVNFKLKLFLFLPLLWSFK